MPANKANGYSRSSTPFIMLALVLLLCLLLLCACQTDNQTETQIEPPAQPVTIALTDGEFLIDSQELTLPNCTEDDLLKLSSFNNLKTVDARGASCLEAIFKASQACDIEFIYSSAIGDTTLLSTQTEFKPVGCEDLSVLTSVIPYYPKLAKIDLTAHTYDNAAVMQLKSDFPNIDILWSVDIDACAFPSNAQSIDLSMLSNLDAASITAALPCFDSLSLINLGRITLDKADSVIELQKLELYTVSFEVDYLGKIIPFNTTEADISNLAFDYDSTAKLIELLKDAKSVRLSRDAPQEQAEQLALLSPDKLIIYGFGAFGREILTDTAILDLTELRISDVSRVETTLSKLPLLERVILCDTGITTPQVLELKDKYPTVRFVWTVRVGSHRVRTDAIGFSTLNPGKNLGEFATVNEWDRANHVVRLQKGQLAELIYCEDLVALDLGHNYLTDSDLEVIAQLNKLEVLILADNKLTDISPLKSLKNLKYIELFMNRIPDVSTLAELEELLDININNIGLMDTTPLYGLKNCERLWIGDNKFSGQEGEALAQALPNCHVNYTQRGGTGDGWRDHERYEWMRSLFSEQLNKQR